MHVTEIYNEIPLFGYLSLKFYHCHLLGDNIESKSTLKEN